MLQAKSRILPTDVVVPLNPTSTPGTLNVTDDDFTNWRHYLAITKEMDHSLDSSMQKVILSVQDFYNCLLAYPLSALP